jgi:hypothetical protein
LAVPVEFVGHGRSAGSGFFDALAVAVVEIGLAASGDEVIFGVIGVHHIAGLSDVEVPGCVVGVADDLVVCIHGDSPAPSCESTNR